MNENSELDELLIKAEFGLLEEDEKIRLEEILANSSNLEKIFALHEDFNMAFAYPEDMELKGKLDLIFKQETKKRYLRIYSGIAALLVLLIGVASIYIWNPNKPVTSQDLFKQYYSTPSLAADRAPSVQINNIYQEAVTFYTKKDYKNAEMLFSTLVSSDSSNTLFLLYSGICQIEQARNENAIKYFEKVIKLNDPVTRESAMWYLSLCYLTINEKKAVEMLNEIVRLNGDYSTKAKDILKKLNSN